MKTLPPELDAKITEVKSWMLDGDLDKVATKARKSKVWVCNVLNKKAFNADILEAGIEVMNYNKARFECNEKLKVA